ncbi:ABC transporter permease [Tunturiibacter lichenicola]|uniref:ABC transporter permease n=1 Tax=Tunturiibacter lichenicola TaxID=2051959 RepID=UPI0021B253DF|nr:ABC transporter permease [Edaphobacter lichenicola]
MQTIFQDLRFSIRTLRRSPGFALIAVLTLALGIASVTSIFSVVNSVLLKPFAFPEANRLVVLRETARELNYAPFPDNYKHYLNWKSNSKTLASAAIFRNNTFSVSSGTDHPEIVGGLNISSEFFSVLGVEPALGRSFLPTETTKGHDNVVILAWSTWQRYFAGDPSVIGRTLTIGGTPETVVGVLPQSFSFPHMNEMATAVSQQEVRPYEIFQPLVPDPSFMNDTGGYDFLVVGRLKAGVSPTQVESELGGLQESFVQAAHISLHPWIVVESLKQEVAGTVSTALWLLLAAVGAVLLIGCVNLANLQLARAVAREREIAVRAALGATRERLVRSTLMDSIVLAAAGGALGILLSFTGVRLFVAAAPASLPRLNETHVSWPILLAAAALSILTALLFGALPALRSMRVDPQSAMQSNSNRVTNSRAGQRTRNMLVAGEIACTVVLMIVTALLLRSFSRLLTQQREFDSTHVTLAQVDLYAPQYGDTVSNSDKVRAEFIDRALEGLGRMPGIQSVAMTSEMPLAGETWVDGIHRPDHPVPQNHEPPANMRWVSPSYIDTLKIPLIEGRNLQPSDREHPTNALISQQSARTIWPGEDPLGKTFTTGEDATYTVVGVVADARINDLKKTASMIYLPYWQNPWWRAYFLIRSSHPISTDTIRREIWKIDPQVAIPVLKSLDDQVNDSVATERFQTILLSAFGAAALLLALLGVYGVLAYSVSLREQEFGIRIALGSGRAALMRLVLRQAAVPVVGGILAGLALALMVTRWIQTLLYETRAIDPAAITVTIALLLTAALLAALLPARRAASVDPIKTLKME